MFQKAAGFVRTLSKAGCETPASMYFDSVCQKIIQRQPDSYNAGFSKLAQTASDDAWKPVAGTTVGSLPNRYAVTKEAAFSARDIGGGLAKLFASIAGLIRRGATGNELSRVDPYAEPARQLPVLPGMQTKAVRKPIIRFSDGNPFDTYHDYMTR